MRRWAMFHIGKKFDEEGERGMEERVEKEEVLTLREAAEYLRLSEMTILRLAIKGDIRGTKIGRQWRFSREVIQSLIEA